MSSVLPYGPEFANHPLRDPFYFPDDTPRTKQPSFMALFELRYISKSQWMTIPYERPQCDPGLEYLAFVDQLYVHQLMLSMDVFGECNKRNKYIIRNNRSQVVYTSKEDNNCCDYSCSGYLCPFVLKVGDFSGFPAISFHRKVRCDSCCCPCCMQAMDIKIFPDTVIGRVRQEWSLLKPSYRVETAEGETMFKITGPACPSTCFGDPKFLILSTAGKEVGTITKEFPGFKRDLLSDGNHFGVTFPMALDVKMKAALLGALFLIDFNYFRRCE